MSPAHVLAPTYRRLKRAVMDGIWPGGTRLEALRLADEFGVSMTPVRDSLNQLVGEGLVDLTPGEGFRVAALTERALRDLLQMNSLLLATASEGDWNTPSEPEPVSDLEEYAERLAAVFSQLAVRSGNCILVDFVTRIGERLHPVRRREPEVLPQAFETLEQLENSMEGSADERQKALRRYHRICQRKVPHLVSCLAG
jgi:hypothetical protein